MVSAIRAQLPTPWQYNLENDKSQDLLDHKFEIYPEIRAINQPEWGTERYFKRNSFPAPGNIDFPSAAEKRNVYLIMTAAYPDGSVQPRLALSDQVELSR